MLKIKIIGLVEDYIYKYRIIHHMMIIMIIYNPIYMIRLYIL